MKLAWRLTGWFAVVLMSFDAPCRGADEHPADAGPFARALWAVQLFGTEAAADPRNDQRTKLSLASSLAKNGAITKKAVENQLMDAETFARIAGGGAGIDSERVQGAIEQQLPASRRRLFVKLAAHLDELTTSFDRIDPAHLKAGEQLADWIAAHYETGKELPLVFVCTGNSRRSILGATMASAAAAYWGLPEIRGYSGGTEPSAFNSRSVTTLRAAGFEIEPTGDEAPRGLEQAPNPIYAVRWGKAGDAAEPAMETREFSKHYSDPHNPQGGFAALMVCTHADQNCPIVAGASRRISLPYLDPKAYDDGEYETAKYAERRDDLGRLMLAVMLKARRKLSQAGKLK